MKIPNFFNSSLGFDGVQFYERPLKLLIRPYYYNVYYRVLLKLSNSLSNVTKPVKINLWGQTNF